MGDVFFGIIMMMYLTAICLFAYLILTEKRGKPK
jgi:ABC-type multidrug transport system permease subunit